MYAASLDKERNDAILMHPISKIQIEPNIGPKNRVMVLEDKWLNKPLFTSL